MLSLSSLLPNNRVSDKVLTLNFGKESVRSPFGIRSGSVRANFGPKFSEAKIPNFKNLQCGCRRGGGGPLAAVPSPAAWRALAAAAPAAQIENFCKKVSIESICYGIFCETPLVQITEGRECVLVDTLCLD